MTTIKKHPGRSGNADPNKLIRGYRFEIHLSTDELTALNARCQSSRHTALAAYARDFLLTSNGTTAKDTLAAVNQCALALNRIGNNVNQIARHLNTHKGSGDHLRMSESLSQVQQSMRAIADELIRARRL